MKAEQPKQRSPDWFKQRAGRVTGSRAGALLGHSPYQSGDDAIRSMVREYHGAPSEFVGGPHIDWGVNNEDGAIWQFELETGKTVEDCGFFAFEDWMGASPDGLIDDDAILEVKCPYSRRNGGEFKSIDDQPHYYDQMQLEMISTGRTKAFFYQWSPQGSKLEIVHLDPQWHEINMPYLRQKHALYLSELDNPDHLEPLRKEINTDAVKKMLDEYDQLGEAIANAQERQKEVKAAIIDAAGGSNALMWGRKVTKVERKGNVQYAKVVNDFCPEADLEKYRSKGSVSWKIT